VQHELSELITQRVMAIALGYEDANDVACVLKVWRRGWDTHPGLFDILPFFSNMRENRMNIGDFYGLACCNSFNCSA
jgi:hypothetical protein